MTPESLLVHDVLDLLQRIGVYAWRNNTGQRGGVRYGFRGSADVLGVTRDGRFLAIEAKVDTKLSSFQQAFLDEVSRRGGVALVVRPDTYERMIMEALT
jgi:hypothetical protein